MIIVTVEGCSSQSIPPCRLRLFHDSVFEASSVLVDNSIAEMEVDYTFNPLQHNNKACIGIVINFNLIFFKCTYGHSENTFLVFYTAKESVVQESSRHHDHSNYATTSHFKHVELLHTKKKTMNEKMEISSRHQGSVEHRSNLVQHLAPYNRGMKILYYLLIYIN